LLDPNETPYHEPLGGGLSIRTARDERDVERVARLNGVIHDEGVIGLTRALALHYPGMRGRDLVFVEDEASGEVISSLCLVPWTVIYEGIRLPVGELGIVGTLESHRRRGLVRRQVAYFKRRMAERGCLLSLIQGIPYYYRQFGYEYAIPLEGGLRFTARDLPPAPETGLRFRPATVGDVQTLAHLYDEAARDLAFNTARDEAVWRYLFQHTPGTETEAETLIIEDEGGRSTGYLRLPAHHFDDELAVNECSRLGYDAAVATLGHAAMLAAQRNAPGVRLNLPRDCTLARAARAFGAHDLGAYAWQIHVPDVAALLQVIGPALESRIAASPFAGLTKDVPLCFYQDSVVLRFAGGRLVEVVRGRPAEGEINLPPHAFTPLLFGHHSLDELRAVYPDVSVDRAWRLLVETLFPKVTAFLYPSY
jgi:hypothetical protein